jgi:hypothetical protein
VPFHRYTCTPIAYTRNANIFPAGTCTLSQRGDGKDGDWLRTVVARLTGITADESPATVTRATRAKMLFTFMLNIGVLLLIE